MASALIPYAELSWPEVAVLPRHLPLLIPLGLDTYDLDAVLRSLGSDQAILMPPLPYGFARADDQSLGRLAVPHGLLRRVLLGIGKELRAQGFRRLIYLNGHGPQPIHGRGIEFLDAPCRQYEAPDWPSDLATRVVVISTGHTEQHGHHLPLNTDTLIVEAIARGLGQQIPDEVFCLPAWPYGVSTHTREFPGTLNLGGRVFEDLFLALVDRLVMLGAQMIYFSNGHGGNHSFLVNVVKLAGERYPACFVATEWLHTTGPALERYRQSGPGGMGHGGELETSYLLHLRPDLVRMDRATREVDFVGTANYVMDWVESGRMIANPCWRDDTASGIYGDATLGTARKGQLWLQAAVQERVSIVREVCLQHRLRCQKRQETP